MLTKTKLSYQPLFSLTAMAAVCLVLAGCGSVQNNDAAMVDFADATTSTPSAATTTPIIVATTTPAVAVVTKPKPKPTPVAVKDWYPVVKIVDGDTLDVKIGTAVKRVRLLGVDTPEIVDPKEPVQCFGQEASDFAKKTLTGQSVRLVSDASQSDTDQYGRLLRYVYLADGSLFDQTLIAGGYGWEYTFKGQVYAQQKAFLAAQAVAKAKQLGLWSKATCDGRHMEAKDKVVPMVPANQDSVLITGVSFSAQAPLGHWSDSRFGEACEEMSSLLVSLWAKGQKTLTAQEAENDIIALTAWEEQNYHSYIDTSAQDTAERLLKNYYQLDNVTVSHTVSVEAMIAALRAGNLLIVPTNGQLLGNPFYTPPGPDRHMLIVKGYDSVKNQFITNDVGTRRGENYAYDAAVLLAAIRDYPSGDHVKIFKKGQAMIIIGKQK